MSLDVESADLPNGVRLRYVEQGEASGVPLVLLHGIADSWRMFEPLLQHLPGSIRAFALSQRGHGDASRAATGYRPEDFAADLAAFMDVLELEGAVIAGGSSGGVNARRFAIDHPERTLGLVLLGSPFSLRDKPVAQEMWDSTFAKLTDPIDPSLARGFAVATVGGSVTPGIIDMVVEENLKAPAHVWRATMEGLLADTSSEELQGIDAPTLIVWGDQDPILPRSDQEALLAAIPGSRLIAYPGGGHVFYLESPERVAADLAAFVGGLARP